ncbi:MAG TPA: hypothetical protein VGO15_08165 [Candidatus Limnocylindrales bacterium]|nr:hypothetical protein [Candidatus Limnocylindrales bacterium]
MDFMSGSGLTTLAGVGVVAGLVLLGRGLVGYRSVVQVSGIGTSSISSLAAGEARITGAIEAAEISLVSLLQSVPCVYYRSVVEDAGKGRTRDAGVSEERSIGFRVRDATGAVRVFPRGARFDAPLRFDEETGLVGDEPGSLEIRQGGTTQASEIDQASAEAALLTVHDPRGMTPSALRDGRRRAYREWRLVPGDLVTIIGQALPFSELADPTGADLGSGPEVAIDDPEVAADIAAARSTGVLAEDAAAAWGNAAVAGFGIGRPVAAVTLDPAARRLPIADASEAARVEDTFHIAPETLVLAASDEVPLLIAHGAPGAVAERGQDRFLVGLLGAVLAIASAMVFAISLGGGLR